MKVSDLIALLQTLDQDKYILISGYEGGADFPETVSEVEVTLDQNTEWYYGKHEVECHDREKNAYMLRAK